ncbi:PAS domain-containing protein [Paludibacterium denitrificans]|uniref:PAS domain S-box protein n=1 Tax=Paludibacterium denitrificans TaxID=2675226 RepID=A0A844GAP6_9NEIS|nr:PAS domain S-box protein [Paludibacterium denitrificans]MTD33536.1 PAS domain S-box protein [Paludibacterium denitrificans]
MLTDAKASIINVNPAFCLLTGYSREEAIGKNPNFLKSGYQPETFYRDMWQSVLEQGHWRGEIWNQRKSGDIYPELLSIAAVHNPAGAITNYIGIFSDISLLKEQQNNLERQGSL